LPSASLAAESEARRKRPPARRTERAAHTQERIEFDMTPYAIVGSGLGTAEATSLRARLMAWHDAMVMHERRLRLRHAADGCDDECPHVEARALWAEVSALLGTRAGELTFLRSRALNGHAGSAKRRSRPFGDTRDRSRVATMEAGA
jgi:hypothetical protein